MYIWGMTRISFEEFGVTLGSDILIPTFFIKMLSKLPYNIKNIVTYQIWCLEAWQWQKSDKIVLRGNLRILSLIFYFERKMSEIILK